MAVNRAPSSIYRDPRWAVVRLQAKRRDGWKCVECSARGRLEVHHVKRAKHFPELAYDLDNLKTLCGRCHARVTASETGIAPLSPERRAWRDLVTAPMAQSQTKELLCLLP